MFISISRSLQLSIAVISYHYNIPTVNGKIRFRVTQKDKRLPIIGVSPALFLTLERVQSDKFNWMNLRALRG